jgi:membrane protease YdiL (CAAX protease family)
MSIGDNLSLSIGIEKIITLPIGIILSFILLNFLKKNKLLTEYGLKRSSTPPSIMLYYIPLLILISANLWNGITLNFEIHETIFYILSMICVGFLEEIIFRGLLFKEISYYLTSQTKVLFSSLRGINTGLQFTSSTSLGE